MSTLNGYDDALLNDFMMYRIKCADPFQKHDSIPIGNVLALLPRDETQCINREARRQTRVTAIAAVASMPEAVKESPKVKRLLYLVNTRTTDRATDIGAAQAVEAANELVSLAKEVS